MGSVKNTRALNVSDHNHIHVLISYFVVNIMFEIRFGPMEDNTGNIMMTHICDV